MSRLYPSLALPSGLSGRHVTSDTEKAREYDVDPLNNGKATARWFTESLAAIERAHAGASRLDLPTLLLYGGADQVASADATDRFAGALTMRDCTRERLAGAQHELVNEPPEVRGRVIERVGAWLIERA
jgi:alpha-beta hydrolase superfamily lysophospholipase